MKITFDEKTTEKLQALEPADFVLDFDHELSEKLEDVDACAGGISRWRIVAVDKGKVPEVFDAKLESSFGDVAYKSFGKMFFNDDLFVRVEGSYNLTSLRTNGELISSNLQIVDFKGKEKIK